MNHLRIAGMPFVLAAISVFPLGCSMDAQESESVDSVTQALPPGQCNRAEAKDVYIAQLVKDSWLTGYPLTRLSSDASGAIVGPNLPDAVAGDLEIINSIEAARVAVAKALVKVTGLPEYVIEGTGEEIAACVGIPAWTPTGETTVDTTSIEILVGATNQDSWLETQKQFSKVCSLIKRTANRDFVDPAGDGSTNNPPSATVSASGVRANAFGNCPTGIQQDTFCKLSYATGINYTGRTCRLYNGATRCLLY
ncbi:MAG: hypothetical protein QM784_08905 [Polyangiaceae bacterium]